MKYLKIFEDFNSEELDYDVIQSKLKGHGWGDISPIRFDEFEESEYYSGTLDTEEYAEEMNDYLRGISTGDMNYYFSIKVDDYSEISTANRIYHKLKDIFKGKTNNEDGIFYFQEEEDFDKFYDLLLDSGISEDSIISGDYDYVSESKKSGVTASLKKKSKASGIPVGILRKVFSKGMQAWNAGHRPGVAQHQWAFGRVNSFITGAGGARKADADLWAKAKATKARKKKKK